MKITFLGGETNGDGMPYWAEYREIYLPKAGYTELGNAIRKYLERYIAQFDRLKTAGVI